ncbi:MAG: hypothetical protein RIC19_05900 [Phaeodactylibacter sp.]|uniref:hypothetical protein n=1 Tax=Phaeodactylibacter sp. TaxID=1940289 RepID=UPI0032ECB4E7
MLRTALVSSLLFFVLVLYGQNRQRYTADFTFERGIYPTLADWKAQTPVKPEEIIVDIDPQNRKFFQYLFARDQFRFPRNNEIVYLTPDAIFGYSPDGQDMYYRTNYQFEVIGSICLLQEVDQVDRYSSFINPGDEYKASRKEGTGKLYVLDFETGAFFRCRPGKVEKIFKQDPEFYQKYKAAKGKRKDKVKAFIKEYNFKHPVYFK